MLVIILLVGLLAPVTGNIGNTRQKITLSDDGGYGNILIAIDESIPEDLDLLLGLQVIVYYIFVKVILAFQKLFVLNECCLRDRFVTAACIHLQLWFHSMQLFSNKE